MSSDQETELSIMGKRASITILVISVILALAEFIIHRHSNSEAEAFPLFYGLYGFAAFITVVIGGILLREFIMRDKDYYDVD